MHVCMYLCNACTYVCIYVMHVMYVCMYVMHVMYVCMYVCMPSLWCRLGIPAALAVRKMWHSVRHMQLVTYTQHHTNMYLSWLPHSIWSAFQAAITGQWHCVVTWTHLLNHLRCDVQEVLAWIWNCHIQNVVPGLAPHVTCHIKHIRQISSGKCRWKCL